MTENHINQAVSDTATPETLAEMRKASGQFTASLPCGGCGAETSRERCIGCLHDFGTPDSAWVRKYNVVTTGELS